MKLPDGPKIHSLFQLIKWIKTPLEFYDDCAKRYGDIFTIRLFGYPPIVFIANSQGVEQIFKTKPQSFSIGPYNEMFHPLFGNKALVLMAGEHHRRERKLLMPPFHDEKVKSYTDSIYRACQKVSDEWKVDRSFTAIDSMREIVLEVILEVFFGLTQGDRYQFFKSSLAEWVDISSSPMISSLIFMQFLQKDLGAWSSWGKFLRLKRKIKDFIQAEIEERRTHPQDQSNDILSFMLSATYEDGQLMTDEQVFDELMNLVGAAAGTTAIALTWALYCIHKFPGIKEKLIKEIDSLGDNPDPVEISRLPYLTATCQEILRIYPPNVTTNVRFTNSSIEIMGHQFEAGTSLVVCTHLIHGREDIYPEPKQFLPERFLERKYSTYEFIPFGGGHRICIGKALAMLEMKIAIASILSRYELVLANNEPVKPKRSRVNFTPSNGIPLVMRGKRPVQKAVVL
ncbi:MAG: cytochrome P450 [Mastigocoleus sp.]